MIAILRFITGRRTAWLVLAGTAVAVGLLSWRYSARTKPTFSRMQSIASTAKQAPVADREDDFTVPSAASPEPFAKSLPRLAPSGLSELETRATSLVKRLDVSALDPDIPSQHFAEWFQQTMGAEQSISWELNDCGEARGNPELDKQRDMPLCVEARAQSAPQLETETSVILQVGTERKGLFAKPVLRAIVQQEGDEFVDIKNLHDLAPSHPVN